VQGSIPVIIAGGGVIAFGLYLLRHQANSWRKQQSKDLPQKDLDHFQSQYRRRKQTSWLLVVIGVLMVGGDLLLTDHKNPLIFVIWVIGLLLLVAWVVLLAVGDWVAIRAYSQAALSEIRMQQMALEREAERLRERTRSNGNGKSHRT